MKKTKPKVKVVKEPVETVEPVDTTTTETTIDTTATTTEIQGDVTLSDVQPESEAKRSFREFLAKYKAEHPDKYLVKEKELLAQLDKIP